MGDEHVIDLIEEALDNSALRHQLSQDRTSSELAETANRFGFGLSDEEARKILAGAYLTREECTEEERRAIMGGLAWDFPKKVEDRLNRDFSLLEDREAWERTKDFYENVFLS